jgi:signal transduction histidine kinase
VTTTRRTPVERTMLERDGGHLAALIADDGRGFDPPSSGDYGLHSMHDGAIRVGTLQLPSTAGRGSQVRVSVPSAIGP